MDTSVAFPGYEVAKSIRPEFNPIWWKILSSDLSLAKATISSLLGVTETSLAHSIILEGQEIGALIPRRKKDSKNARMWKLFLRLSPSHFIVFGNPINEFFENAPSLPDAFMNLVRGLGAVQFDQYGGGLIWPSKIEQASAALGHPKTQCFYDYATGDFDCWRDENFEEVYRFDHESRAMSLVSSGGFGRWCENRISAAHKLWSEAS